jgi:hypothetical protein
MNSENRDLLAVRRILSILLARIRKLIGTLLQAVQGNQLDRIEHETRRLGSASVESVTYIGKELQALSERLSRVEEELSAVRRLLDQRPESTGGDADDRDEVRARSTSG